MYPSKLEFEAEVDTRLDYEIAVPPRITIRVVRRSYRESEIEGFDPVPPLPGTTIISRFAFGSSTLSASHRTTIRRVASEVAAGMSSIPALHCSFVDTVGHEDELGDPARFGELGLARGLTVARTLATSLDPLVRRLPAASRREVRIEVSSAGPTRPIRSNVTEDGRALNRRVEIRRRVAPCGLIA
jgi:outer membrane protein OmpA-like peptidoglycan-associated protein